MVARLSIRRLRLLGVGRDYEVSFLDQEGQPAALAIVAGQISTGKTSVLEFISYCLGGKDFPHHPEIRTRVRSAQLECDMQGSTYVIERAAVQQPSKTATIHSCDLDGMEAPHATKELKLAPAGDPESLSQYLLGQFGIGHVVLKEAPTKDSSAADRLSIRDLLRLMFIENPDLDNRNLLLEHSPPVVRLKHEQVLDLMFWAHDNSAASLASEVKALEEEIAERDRELRTIEAFMVEQRVPDREVLAEQGSALDEQSAEISVRLEAIEERMEAEAAFGDQQRSAYQSAGLRARRLANEQREARTQLDRLTSLAAQYDQDVKKLVFAKEASRLFDPLSIQVCPWCLQPVDKSAEDSEDECSVCHQALAETVEAVNIDRELRSVRTRHKELAGYLTELYERELDLTAALAEAGDEQRRAQETFDEAMRARFSPFMAERDAILEELSRVSSAKDQLSRLLAMHVSRERRRRELGAVRQRLAEIQAAQLAAAETSVSREQVIDLLNVRFAEILAEFHFPKLSDPMLDSRYVPSVRGVRYDLLGSSGAMTLISLAWYLTIFEKAVEEGGAHPGLLMIDSPQKNLVPASGVVADDYQAPAIARGVYEHLVKWCQSESGSGSQVIVVDNDPPQLAVPFVVARFSGDAGVPPYGLIDDATE